MTKRLAALAALLALLAGGCAKAQTGWITDVDEASSLADRTKKDLAIFFTGSDWDDQSKDMTASVFTEEFFKTTSKDFVLCNVDILRDDSAITAEVNEARQKAAADYGVKALPYVVLATAEGDLYGSSTIPKEIRTVEAMADFLSSFMDAREKLVGLKRKIEKSKGAERAKNIDTFIEAADPSQRERYVDLIREVPDLDADGSAGLRGKYQLQVAYLDAIEHYKKGEHAKAGERFKTIAEGGTLNPAQTQEAWYMCAYMYAMSRSVPTDQIVAWLEMALNADPENQGAAQIKKAIVQVKAKAEADKKADAEKPTDGPK